MKRHIGGDRHYRVVRYYTDFNAGNLREEIAERLTLEEAEQVAARYRGQIPGEEIVIQDQDVAGLESEVLAERDDSDVLNQASQDRAEPPQS